MKLYFSNGSPFARKVRIVLLEKRLAFDEDLQSKLRLPGEVPSPTLSVPALEDKGLQIWESDLIVDYLMQTYPHAPGDTDQPPLTPWLARPERRWQDMTLLATIATYGSACVNMAFMRRDDVTPENSDYMARQHLRIEKCLDWLEEQATPEGFAPGWFSVMDIAFICNATYAVSRPNLAWRGRPRLEALYDRFQDRPSVAATPIGPPPLVARQYTMHRMQAAPPG